MRFNVKKRGKLTYYYNGDAPVLSALVTEEQPDGDLKISFAGLTGGYSAKGVLGLDELVSMDPHKEIPLVFQCWEKWLQEAGICASLKDVDFIEVHAFGCQPKSPNPLVDPAGFAAEQERLRKAYSEAYSAFFHDYLPENGVPARFTVHVVDVPDKAASYEFYATALYQKALQC
jgi:enamine deaminase RidA (YjgF/YER057c/UK114 family)